jgi:integrase
MKFKRTKYQFGCLQLKERKYGPPVWVLRYRKFRPDGTTKLASQMIGTAEQYRTASEAWKAAEVFRLAANPDNPAQHGVSWGALIDRYVAKEIPPRSARKYLGLLNNFAKPKWGSYAIADVKPFAFQEWLDNLKSSKGERDLAPKTKTHVRSIMHILYDCAMRWGLVPIGVNPFGKRLILIKHASKRLKKRHSMTVEQFHRLLEHEPLTKEPLRTMVIAAICVGLRCSELFALKWSDFDWDRLEIQVQRRIVEGEIGDTKTEYSEAPVPLAAELAEVFWNWKLRSPYEGSEDFVFAKPDRGGRVPYDPYKLQQDVLRPAGIAIGFGDGLGWHTFRHTYRTWLDETGAPITVQQELMRHADSHTTLDYGEALTPSKRKANLKVVKLALPGRQRDQRKTGERR